MRARTLLSLAAVLIACCTPSVAFAVGETGGGSSVDPALNSNPCDWCHQGGGDVYQNRQGPHGGFSAVTSRCEVCHEVHTATSSEKLLFKVSATDTCLACHDGTGAYGVYGALRARGVEPAGGHRAVPPQANVVKGGDAADGGDRIETAYKGAGGTLSCIDCHSPHGSNIVDAYPTERERASGGGWNAQYKTMSTNLLKKTPNGSNTTTAEYGSDWCRGCHRGRHSGGGVQNHPVDSTAERPDPYTYSNVPLAAWPGPIELAADAAGNVYVADPGNGRVQKFTSAGAYVTQWDQAGGSAGSLMDPRGVVVAGGEVLVSDPKAGYINRYDTSGAFLGTYLQPSSRWGITSPDARSITPSGLGSDRSRSLIADADTEGNHVNVRSADFTYVHVLGQAMPNPFPGTAADQFYEPTDAVIDSAGNVYVVDSMNNRIDKYDATGALVTTFGSRGSGPGQFDRPLSIAIDAADRLYVVDSGNHRVCRLSSAGAFQTSFGGLGAEDGRFRFPRGIAIDDSGAIYVLDAGNERVQKFSAAEAYLSKWGARGSGDGQFDFNPVEMGSMAFDTSRSLGWGTPYGGRGFLMPEPRSAQQAGHYPICQQCHEDSRNAGSLYDGVAEPAIAFTVPDGDTNMVWFTFGPGIPGSLGPRDVATPRFQTFPHETVNDAMLVETYDNLCLNCHGRNLP